MTSEMANRVKEIDSISRAECRKRIEKNFTLERQAKNYLNLYKRLISV